VALEILDRFAFGRSKYSSGGVFVLGACLIGRLFVRWLRASVRTKLSPLWRSNFIPKSTEIMPSAEIFPFHSKSIIFPLPQHQTFCTNSIFYAPTKTEELPQDETSNALKTPHTQDFFENTTFKGFKHEKLTPSRKSPVIQFGHDIADAFRSISKVGFLHFKENSLSQQYFLKNSMWTCLRIFFHTNKNRFHLPTFKDSRQLQIRQKSTLHQNPLIPKANKPTKSIQFHLQKFEALKLLKIHSY
jgi:hypothetical protein